MTLRLRSGQTLVVLLMFVGMAMVVMVAAVAMVVTNSQSGSKFGVGQEAWGMAESGAEEGVLRLLRDPAYSGGTLTMAGGTTTISVTGTDPKTIVASATEGNFTRKIQVVAGYTNNILTVQSWSEIP